MRRLKAFLLIFPALLVLGCSDSNTTTGETLNDGADSNLLEIAWELRQYTANSGSLTAVNEATKYQFLLDSESTNVEIYIGCVNYSDSIYEKRDGYLLITLGSRDAVDCNTDAEEFAEQTNAIINLLQDEGSGQSTPLMYTVSSDSLQLESADGRMLIFVKVETVIQQGSNNLSSVIENTEWSIIYFQNKEEVRHEIPSDAQWGLEFENESTNADSKLSVFLGPCGYFKFTYLYDANEIQKQAVIIPPDGGCTATAPLQFPELETQVYQMFDNSNTFTLSINAANNLVLSAETGEILELEIK